MIGLSPMIPIGESPLAGGQQTLRRALWSGSERLSRAGIETARLDAEVLLGHVLGLTREQIVILQDRLLEYKQVEQYGALLKRRLERTPVAYLTGQQEFWSLDFRVTPEVLIPRADTERLVEIALMLMAGSSSAKLERVLDLGTGSGAIVISLAKELPNARFWAVDISPAALAVARGNAFGNCVAERIQFVCADLFTLFVSAHKGFDLIVSNPPYIRSAEIAELAPEVSLWEPRLALDGGADGLDFYRRIATEAHSYLTRSGAIAVEVGADMATLVAELFAGAGYTAVKTFQDYAGRDRVVIAENSVS